MEAILNIVLGLVVMAVVVGGAGLVIVKWWLQPLFWTIQEEQWGWALFLLLTGWFGGLVYLGRYVEDIPMASTTGFAKGTHVTVGPFRVRVVKINSETSMRVLKLGEVRSAHA